MHNQELVPDDHPNCEGEDPDPDINQNVRGKVRHNVSTVTVTSGNLINLLNRFPSPAACLKRLIPMVNAILQQVRKKEPVGEEDT
jgi:hypothetical protein